ncbi:hypothetical protein KKC83_01805 [Patescibacteria group bacterium]|nr:hypothetical protein [Candidatus Falkowbacteria bacterium]MBU3905575.1 hypothetical protein [Patescibacteria group bacterium]MBU4015688.1 hypothetical protein [Patescibacteria group bacterium]MBU4026260.1 hypothetical protein [Patescibacteria group bacterium]MBU4103184.1 hypothetical protein [Patescibacteria group bacterium]
MTEKKEKKEKNVKTEKIRLIHGKVKIVSNRINVTFEALVIGTNGKIKTNCPISFYDDDFNLLLNAATGEDGKTHYTHNVSLDQVEKTITIRVQIDGSPAEAFDSVKLLPDMGKGLTKIYRCARYNVKNKFKSILKYLAKAVPIFVIGWIFLNYANGSYASISLGIIIGAILFKVAVPKFLLGTGFLCGIILFSYFFPSFLTNSLLFATKYFLFVGLTFYLLEELTYQLIIEEKEEKKTINWEKLVNFYPTFPLSFALIAILYHTIIGLVGIFMPGDENTAMDVGKSINAIEFFGYNTANFEGKWNIPFSNEALASKHHLLDIIDWIIAFVALFIYALPGEFMGLIKGKSGISDTGRVVERVFFFKELLDILKGFMRRKR